MYYAIKLVIPGRTAVGMVGVFVFVVVSARTTGTEIGNTIAADLCTCGSIFDLDRTVSMEVVTITHGGTCTDFIIAIQLGILGSTVSPTERPVFATKSVGTITVTSNDSTGITVGGVCSKQTCVGRVVHTVHSFG